jgi:hypothetical protein
VVLQHFVKGDEAHLVAALSHAVVADPEKSRRFARIAPMN